jgi:UDP-N-acetylglucosamine transferase subunit ALG13
MPERFSIFASVGNATQPFDRFLRMVDEAAERTRLSALVQTGSGKYRPSWAQAVDFVTRVRFEELLIQADHVITHAGVGSVMTAVRLGKVPIVIPRRKADGEVINDHQQELAEELSQVGCCRAVSSVDELVECLLSAPAAPPPDAGFSNWRMKQLVDEFISRPISQRNFR